MLNEEVTLKLGAVNGQESDEYKAALENVRNRMKAVMLEFGEATPSFGSAVSQSIWAKHEGLHLGYTTKVLFP